MHSTFFYLRVRKRAAGGDSPAAVGLGGIGCFRLSYIIKFNLVFVVSDLILLSFRPKAEALALADAEKSPGRGARIIRAYMFFDRASIYNKAIPSKTLFFV